MPDTMGLMQVNIDPTVFVTFGAIFLGFFLLKSLIISRVTALTQKTSNHWDDALTIAINKLTWIFYGALAVYMTIQIEGVAGRWVETTFKIVTIIVAFYLAKAIGTFLVLFTEEVVKRKDKDSGNDSKSILQVIKFAIKLTVWSIAFVLVLQNLGYNVTALIGGLGIAGIAVGLAVQNVLSDLLSFVSIYFDKPFKIGDFIVIGDDMGTVEKIGVKSTRLRTLQGQLLVMPNQELTNTRVNNYQQMDDRRIEFSIGVTYETDSKKLRKIPDMIKKVIGGTDKARVDRVHFKSFGDSALIYEVVYFVDSADYNIYMDVQQEINLAIVDAFAKAKIEMAYPTQTLFVHKMK